MLISIEDAAKKLAVSTRTVRSFIAKGFITATSIPGSRKKWLDADDVEQFTIDRASITHSTFSELKKEVIEARASLRRLRAEMDVVLRILDIHEEALHLTEKEGATLHAAASADLIKESWNLAEIEQWSEILLRLREEDLQSIGGTRPWSVFLKLCLKLLTFVVEHPTYKTNLDLQMLHKKLTEARRRLRITALCYEDLHGTELVELRKAALLDIAPSVKEAMLSRIRQLHR